MTLAPAASESSGGEQNGKRVLLVVWRAFGKWGDLEAALLNVASNECDCFAGQ